MSKLAILGMGTAITAWYIETLHRMYAREQSQWSTAPFDLHPLDFNSINPHLPGDFNALAVPLNAAMENISTRSPHAILVPNITVHEALDALQPEGYSKLLHPFRLAIETCETPHQPVFILGTRHTEKRGYAKHFLQSAGWEVQPTPASLTLMSDELRLAVSENKATSDQLQSWELAVTHLQLNGLIILACTELSMAAAGLSLSGIVDLAQLQLKAALSVISSD